MAKVSQVPKWLSPSVPHIVKVSGAHGETKEFSFQLCLDFNALGLVEKWTGVPLTDPGKIFSILNVTNITTLFWAAIQAYQPEYAGDDGREFIGSILNFKNSGKAVDALWETFLLSVPEETAAKLRAVVEAAQANGGATTPDPTPQTAPASN